MEKSEILKNNEKTIYDNWIKIGWCEVKWDFLNNEKTMNEHRIVGTQCAFKKNEIKTELSDYWLAWINGTGNIKKNYFDVNTYVCTVFHFQ